MDFENSEICLWLVPGIPVNELVPGIPVNEQVDDLTRLVIDLDNSEEPIFLKTFEV